jgi:PleD family two-component response regulator
MYGEAKPPEASGLVDFAGVVHGARPAPGVLVIDDSAAQRMMLVTLLRRWGFRATACADASAALDIARDPGSA